MIYTNLNYFNRENIIKNKKNINIKFKEKNVNFQSKPSKKKKFSP